MRTIGRKTGCRRKMEWTRMGMQKGKANDDSQTHTVNALSSTRRVQYTVSYARTCTLTHKHTFSGRFVDERNELLENARFVE